MLGSNPNASTVIVLVFELFDGPINCEPEATVLFPSTMNQLAVPELASLFVIVNATLFVVAWEVAVVGVAVFGCAPVVAETL